MPFQSEKQRKYLWANEPEIAREWTDKYGSRVKKQDGGYTGTWIPGYTKPINLDPYIYPKDHAQKFDTRKEWATSPQMYHNEIMNDYVTNVSKNLSEIPYVGNVLAAGAELGAPIASGILSLPYELKQSFDDFEKTLAANPEKYNSLGSTALGILQAIDDQNPLSTVYHRTKGALRPIGRRLKNTWDAIKSEFGGSAEAEEMTIEELRDYFEGLSPEDIGLPKRGEADWEKYMRGQIADVPRLSNEEYLAQRGNNLYAGSTGNISGVQWKDDEEEPYDFTERLMRRGDFRPSSSYPSYNAWQMRAAQAPGLKRNIGRVMDFLRGSGTRLTPAQQIANQNYMTQQRITRDPQTGRMIGGLFAGQNAPGTSMFGSKTYKEMAQKWALKNQHRQYKTPEMEQKQQNIINLATGNRDPSQGNTVTGHGKSGMGRDPNDRMAQGGLASLWQR